ncbi:MAG: S8 family serine peptidase [Patescibacteria group bacterium]
MGYYEQRIRHHSQIQREIAALDFSRSKAVEQPIRKNWKAPLQSNQHALTGLNSRDINTQNITELRQNFWNLPPSLRKYAQILLVSLAGFGFLGETLPAKAGTIYNSSPHSTEHRFSQDNIDTNPNQPNTSIPNPNKCIVGSNQSGVGTVLSASANAALASELIKDYGLTDTTSLNQIGEIIVPDCDAELMKLLSEDARNAWVTRDVRTYSFDQNPDRSSDMDNDSSRITRGWGFDRLNQEKLPLDGKTEVAPPSEAGSPVIHVYVMDTAIESDHESLTGLIGQSVTSEDGVSETVCNSHGTGVASIIAAIAGQNIVIHSVPVLECNGFGTGSNFAIAINRIIEIVKSENQLAIINMSMGASDNEEMRQAVEIAEAAGIKVVAASGNEETDGCLITPGNVADLNIGATNNQDFKTQYSNGGKCVTAYGPGEQIVTASTPGTNTYEDRTGTSFSAPFATGILALLMKEFPDFTKDQLIQKFIERTIKGVVQGLSPDDKNRLISFLKKDGGPDLINQLYLVWLANGNVYEQRMHAQN